MLTAIVITAFIGLLLSVYALYVERKASKNPGEKAVCDINDHVSCTKAFTSDYGKLGGFQNSIKGIIFYIAVMVIAFYNMQWVFYLAILSVLGSIYLAYILYSKLKNFCVVCTAIYVVNILLLVFSYLA